MSKVRQYFSKVHEVKVSRTAPAKENKKISKSSLRLYGMPWMKCPVCSTWLLQDLSVMKPWFFMCFSKSFFLFIEAFPTFPLKSPWKKSVKVFTNTLVFKLLKSVPYMPEVEHVQDICRIRDLENHWIAIKIVLALSEKWALTTRWKGTF